MNLKDLVKVAAPVAIGAFAGPAAGAGLKSVGLGSLASSPFATSAIASGLGSILMGQKPKDALRAALLGGIGGATFGGMGEAEAAKTQATQRLAGETAREAATREAAKTAATAATPAVAPTAATTSGQVLQSLGMGEDNLLFKLMNSQMGEGLAAGLLAELLASDDEEEDARGSFERRPYGAGGPGGQLGGINYMADGGEPDYFPRRNGGIDPSEGSGTKDDVPAMLMAGEFVMTRDAVKGAGDGNLRKGIDRMYNMMDDFERMA